MEGAQACDEQAAEAGDGGGYGAAVNALRGRGDEGNRPDGDILAVDAQVVLVGLLVGIFDGVIVPVIQQLAVHVAAAHAQHRVLLVPGSSTEAIGVLNRL